MKNAITWFEIGTANLAKATAFYEAVMGHKMRFEAMGPSEGAVFAYDEVPMVWVVHCYAGQQRPSPPRWAHWCTLIHHRRLILR